MAQKTEVLKLAAIVFTDIVGYSAIVHRDAGLGKRLLDRQRGIVRQQVGAYGGREIETAGDSFLLLFESTVTALSCVADIQRSLQAANREAPGTERVQIRAAIHLGDVEHRDDGVYGDGVNVAARILPFSPESGVALSDIVNRQIKNRLSVPTQSIGTPTLKNIEQPVEIFTLDAASLAAIESNPGAQAMAAEAVHPALYSTRGGKSGEQDRSATLIWKFENATFDESALELTVGGEPVELEKKPLEVLRHLLWHAGEVVTRDELLDAVWPGRILSESVINKCVSRLREALKDEDQHIIRTAHGYGYRLVAEVKVEHPKSTPLPAPRFNFKPGDSPPLRSQWKLKERLGTGGHGEAWLAEHDKTREQRVYKFAFDDQALVALKREITLYRLLHDTLGERPDFVRIIDWNLEEAPCFTEAEHVEGGNLLIWAEQQGGIGKVSLSTRIELAAQIAETLSAAHSVGVLHKDLKPGNVLVEEEGGSPQIKLMDFGSGGVINPLRLDELGITRMGFTQIVGQEDTTSGTPLYLPPEVIAGHPTTVQGDIYALGIILYQLVIGDLRKPLAPGWEADVDDELLREDIAETADGNPKKRLADSVLLAQRLRTLEQRRQQRTREREQKEEEQRTLKAAEATRHENERLKARRAGLLVALAVLVLGLAASLKLYLDARTAKLEAVREATEARALSDFLQWDLFTAINSGKQDTRQLTALKLLLDAGVAKIDERLANQPVAAAKVRGGFALVYNTLGFPGEIRKLELANVALTKRLVDENSPDAVDVGAETIAAVSGLAGKNAAYLFKLNALAHEQCPPNDMRRLWISQAALVALVDRGDFAGAGKLADEVTAGLRTADRDNDDYPYVLRAAYYARAQLYWRTGDLTQAEAVLTEQLNDFLSLKGSHSLEIVGARSALAMLWMQTGRVDEAVALLTAGLKEAMGMNTPATPVISAANVALGYAYTLQQRFTDARAVADAVYALARQQGSDGNFELGLQEALAQQWALQGRLREAEASVRHILAEREKADLPDSTQIASEGLSLADILREEGHAIEAREQLKLISVTTRAILESASPDRIQLRRTEGLLALTEGRRDEAITKLQEALQLSQKVYTDRSFWTIRLRKELAAAQGGLTLLRP